MDKKYGHSSMRQHLLWVDAIEIEFIWYMYTVHCLQGNVIVYVYGKGTDIVDCMFDYKQAAVVYKKLTK